MTPLVKRKMKISYKILLSVVTVKYSNTPQGQGPKVKGIIVKGPYRTADGIIYPAIMEVQNRKNNLEQSNAPNFFDWAKATALLDFHAIRVSLCSQAGPARGGTKLKGSGKKW